MNTVTPLDLANKLVRYLGIQPGEAIEVSRLRSGAILLSKLTQERKAAAQTNDQSLEKKAEGRAEV
jgi:hypothetical protein